VNAASRPRGAHRRHRGGGRHPPSLRWDAGAAGAWALARGGPPAGWSAARQAMRVVDRSRRIGRLVRAIAKTLARRTGQRVDRVVALNAAAAGRWAAGSGRRAGSPSRPAARHEGVAPGPSCVPPASWRCWPGRCQRVVTQIQQRQRGEPLSDRLVSLADRTPARSVRASSASPASSAMWCSWPRSPPTPAAAPRVAAAGGQRAGNPGENRLLAQTAAELGRLGLRPRRSRWTAGLCPARPSRLLPGWHQGGRSSPGVPSRAPDAPAGG
jgi:hypothetical protein